MEKLFNIDNQKCTWFVTIRTKVPGKYRVCAEDVRPNSKYANRDIEVKDERTIFLSFPVSPKTLKFSVVSLSGVKESDFAVNVTFQPLKKYNIWEDDNTQNFLELAIPFATFCGFKLPPKQGQFYQSQNQKFIIKYLPEIIDYKTGQVLNTPARIGHETGKIEISAKAFKKYTIPMRIMIMLHEFSHKYKNPKMNLPISHEIGADINALYIYLGLGFSKVDAIYVYSHVFLRAQTPENLKRMRKIMNYIEKFESEQTPA